MPASLSMSEATPLSTGAVTKRSVLQLLDQDGPRLRGSVWDDVDILSESAKDVRPRDSCWLVAAFKRVFLLALCLGIYVGTPHIAGWSLRVDLGLSGVFINQNTNEEIKRVDRLIDFGNEMASQKWPVYDNVRLSGTWSGRIVVEEPTEIMLEIISQSSTMLSFNEVHMTGTLSVDSVMNSVGVHNNTLGGFGSNDMAVLNSNEIAVLMPGETGISISLQNINPTSRSTVRLLRRQHVSSSNFDLPWELVPRNSLRMDTKVLPAPKGLPYFPVTMTVMARLLSCSTFCCLIFLVGILTGSLKRDLAYINPKNILFMAPCAIGWVCGDLFEMGASRYMDATTYIVLSQLRIVLTAVLRWPIMKATQTPLQWLMLSSLTCTLVAYSLIGTNGHTDFSSKLGLFFTAGKVFASVFAGVYGELVFKTKVPFHISMFMSDFVGVVFGLLILKPTYIYTTSSEAWDTHGFFGSEDGGWDRRTWIVVAWYCGREAFTNLCAKQFDALVKNLCNALASICSYMLAITFFHEEPILAKVVLICVVIFDVAGYSVAKSYKPEKY